MRTLIWLGVISVIAAPACGEAPPGPAAMGTASGQWDGIAVAQSLAADVDATEERAEPPHIIRIYAGDKAIDAAQLMGAYSASVIDLGGADVLRGVLIEFDPARPNDFKITDAAPDRGDIPALAMFRNEDGPKAWKKLEIKPDRISGTIAAKFGEFSFDAPLLANPIVRKLEGPAAQTSDLVALARTYFQARARGDDKAADALASQSTLRGFAYFSGPATGAGAREPARQKLAALKQVTAVIERRYTAMIVLEGDWINVERNRDAWKIDAR